MWYFNNNKAFIKIYLRFVKVSITIKCYLMSFIFLISLRTNLIPITYSHIHCLILIFYLLLLHLYFHHFIFPAPLSIFYRIEIISLISFESNSFSLELIFSCLQNWKILKITRLLSNSNQHQNYSSRPPNLFTKRYLKKNRAQNNYCFESKSLSLERSQGFRGGEKSRCLIRVGDRKIERHVKVFKSWDFGSFRS